MSRSQVMSRARRDVLLLACAALSAIGACATRPAPQVPVQVNLEGTDGAFHPLAPQGSDSYSVVIFFSAECHVLAAHDERVRKLAADFGARGVSWIGVDSEV